MHESRRRPAATWRAVDALPLEPQPTDRTAIDGAKLLMSQPGLAPRDAFHAAHATEAGCDLVVSSDPGFDEVSALLRLGPE